ncbi:uncharacterized protein TNCV_1945901 [Trichonephila clavipes]|uniref:Uncharacterized protein n=1 Tax=Trichonephila clavipes TaxID=2585209 RepID=A0A8X6SEQ9_TRICX|nr:uncharacterized protein TNCV_1945901 [Trichonephila clavipes]
MCCLKLKLDQIEELLLITQLKDSPKNLRTELLLNSTLKKLKEALEKKQRRHKRKYRGIRMKIEEKKDYSSIPEEKIDTDDLLGLELSIKDMLEVDIELGASHDEAHGYRYGGRALLIILSSISYIMGLLLLIKQEEASVSK